MWHALTARWCRILPRHQAHDRRPIHLGGRSAPVDSRRRGLRIRNGRFCWGRRLQHQDGQKKPLVAKQETCRRSITAYFACRASGGPCDTAALALARLASLPSGCGLRKPSPRRNLPISTCARHPDEPTNHCYRQRRRPNKPTDVRVETFDSPPLLAEACRRKQVAAASQATTWAPLLGAAEKLDATSTISTYR